MYKIKQILNGAALATFFGLIITSGTATALTPDGETPANEGVCNALQGGTGGLYGLCVAYCEAQDLDTISKEPPSTKILDNYRKKMQAGDPDMPCVNTSCPCWSDAELASINVVACSRGISTILAIGFASGTHEAFADTTRNRCSYIDLNSTPHTVNTQSIPADQATTCHTQVEAACAAVGK